MDRKVVVERLPNGPKPVLLPNVSLIYDNGLNGYILNSSHEQRIVRSNHYTIVNPNQLNTAGCSKPQSQTIWPVTHQIFSETRNVYINSKQFIEIENLDTHYYQTPNIDMPSIQVYPPNTLSMPVSKRGRPKKTINDSVHKFMKQDILDKGLEVLYKLDESDYESCVSKVMDIVNLRYGNSIQKELEQLFSVETYNKIALGKINIEDISDDDNICWPQVRMEDVQPQFLGNDESALKAENVQPQAFAYVTPSGKVIWNDRPQIEKPADKMKAPRKNSNKKVLSVKPKKRNSTNVPRTVNINKVTKVTNSDSVYANNKSDKIKILHDVRVTSFFKPNIKTEKESSKIEEQQKFAVDSIFPWPQSPNKPDSLQISTDKNPAAKTSLDNLKSEKEKVEELVTLLEESCKQFENEKLELNNFLGKTQTKENTQPKTYPKTTESRTNPQIVVCLPQKNSNSYIKKIAVPSSDLNFIKLHSQANKPTVISEDTLLNPLPETKSFVDLILKDLNEIPEMAEFTCNDEIKLRPIAKNMSTEKLREKDTCTNIKNSHSKSIDKSKDQKLGLSRRCAKSEENNVLKQIFNNDQENEIKQILRSLTPTSQNKYLPLFDYDIQKSCCSQNQDSNNKKEESDSFDEKFGLKNDSDLNTFQSLKAVAQSKDQKQNPSVPKNTYSQIATNSVQTKSYLTTFKNWLVNAPIKKEDDLVKTIKVSSEDIITPIKTTKVNSEDIIDPVQRQNLFNVNSTLRLPEVTVDLSEPKSVQPKPSSVSLIRYINRQAKDASSQAAPSIKQYGKSTIKRKENEKSTTKPKVDEKNSKNINADKRSNEKLEVVPDDPHKKNQNSLAECQMKIDKKNKPDEMLSPKIKINNFMVSVINVESQTKKEAQEFVDISKSVTTDKMHNHKQQVGHFTQKQEINQSQQSGNEEIKNSQNKENIKNIFSHDDHEGYALKRKSDKGQGNKNKAKGNGNMCDINLDAKQKSSCVKNNSAFNSSNTKTDIKNMLITDFNVADEINIKIRNDVDVKSSSAEFKTNDQINKNLEETHNKCIETRNNRDIKISLNIKTKTESKNIPNLNCKDTDKKCEKDTDKKGDRDTDKKGERDTDKKCVESEQFRGFDRRTSSGETFHSCSEIIISNFQDEVSVVEKINSGNFFKVKSSIKKMVSAKIEDNPTEDEIIKAKHEKGTNENKQVIEAAKESEVAEEKIPDVFFNRAKVLECIGAVEQKDEMDKKESNSKKYDSRQRDIKKRRQNFRRILRGRIYKTSKGIVKDMHLAYQRISGLVKKINFGRLNPNLETNILQNKLMSLEALANVMRPTFSTIKNRDKNYYTARIPNGNGVNLGIGQKRYKKNSHNGGKSELNIETKCFCNKENVLESPKKKNNLPKKTLREKFISGSKNSEDDIKFNQILKTRQKDETNSSVTKCIDSQMKNRPINNKRKRKASLEKTPDPERMRSLRQRKSLPKGAGY